MEEIYEETINQVKIGEEASESFWTKKGVNKVVR